MNNGSTRKISLTPTTNANRLLYINITIFADIILQRKNKNNNENNNKNNNKNNNNNQNNNNQNNNNPSNPINPENLLKNNSPSIRGAFMPENKLFFGNTDFACCTPNKQTAVSFHFHKCRKCVNLVQNVATVIEE
jgi:hypothetical protein